MTDAYHEAKEIVRRLFEKGYAAYFAGGWVRDYLMGHPSEDIDIATDASPAQIIDLFPQTILVGLSFGVVIVVLGNHQFEVATFRKDLNYIDGRHPQKIEMSTPLEDAKRRDFTINGIFYDPLEEKIYDYVGGQRDIQLKIIRAIGDPYERFFEDRLRMLRAFRFASRFGFKIETETLEAIKINGDKLFPAVAMERVWQELKKMAAYSRFDEAILQIHSAGLLDVIFPELKKVPLKEIRKQVAAYQHFPAEISPIIYLLELFTGMPLLQKLDIAKRLKISNKELKCIEFMENLKKAVYAEEHDSPVSPLAWAYLFAHTDCESFLSVIAAHYPESKRNDFMAYYESRYQRLASHVHRIREKKPLVSSADLLKRGIKPGKQMGDLLKAAESIVINDDLTDLEQILNQLETLALWKNN